MRRRFNMLPFIFKPEEPDPDLEAWGHFTVEGGIEAGHRLLDGSDPLGTLDMTTHHLPLDQAPEGYDTFQKKLDDCIKVVLKP